MRAASVAAAAVAVAAGLGLGGVAARVTILPNGTVTGLDPAACAAIGNRVDCGYLGILPSDCAARGCCWENSSAALPACFYQGEGVAITKAHVLVSNHFDCGYTALADAVIASYHDTFFPLAASVGAGLANVSQPYSWMTQSWVVSLFLDCPAGLGFACPSAEAVAAFRASVAAGYVTWHAFPHNAELSLLDADLLQFAVNLTHQVDAALGVRRKSVLSQRDVPGMPLAAVTPLAAAGVRAFSEGSNSAMLPPAVPPGFVWQDPSSGANLTVMFHALGYGQLPSQQLPRRRLHDISGGEDGPGGASAAAQLWTADYLQVPGFDEVLVYAWRTDNSGPPQSVAEVLGYLPQVAQWFPNATVQVSDLETFADALFNASAQDSLPLVQADVGDTWLMGVASDPVKTAQYLAMARQRRVCVAAGAAECVVAQGDSPASSAFYNFSRLLLKASEHTWGSTGGVLGNLRAANWSNELFWEEWAANSSLLGASVQSWQQQRLWAIDAPLAALPAASQLRQNISAEWADQAPQWPASPATNGFQRVANVSAELLFLAGGRVHAQFDAATSALVSLVDVANGVQWASPARPLGQYMYQTQSQADIQAFLQQYEYVLNSQSWLNITYGKPGVEDFGAAHVDAFPQLAQLWLRNDSDSATLLALGLLNATLARVAGAPTAVWLQWTFGANATSSVAGRSSRVLAAAGDALPVTWEVQIFNKTGTRMPEASFAIFNPAPGAADPLAAWRARHASPQDPDATRAFADLVREPARRGHPFYRPPRDDEDEEEEEEDQTGRNGDAEDQPAARLRRHTHYHRHGAEDSEVRDGRRRRLHSAYVRAWETVGPLAELWDVVEDTVGKSGAELAAELNPNEYYRAYSANPHYAVTARADVRRALGTCDQCEHIGQARPPLVEDRDALDTWWLSVLGRLQAANDGVAYGGRTLQGTDGLVQYAPLGLPRSQLPALRAAPEHTKGKVAAPHAAPAPLIQFESLDAPLARWGYPMPYPVPFAGPVDTAAGVAFILHNNAWDTNYVFWVPFEDPAAGAAFKWRFALSLSVQQ